MTIATTHTGRNQPRGLIGQPHGIDLLAQRLGLALVAWGERSVDRPVLAERHQRQQVAAQLLAVRDDLRATRPSRLF